MFCENCGNKLKEGHKFCTKCGNSNTPETKEVKSQALTDEKWWYRLSKVFYVLLYLPLLLVIPLVWSENSSNYDYYTRSYTDTTGEAFWYSLLTLIIWVVVVRLIKITFLYIALAQKPQWKKEFKKFF
jgi:uncharacterized membrane protein